MIFTGYSLFAYFIDNKRLLQVPDFSSLFIKESAKTSKNYTYTLGRFVDNKFQKELFIKQSKDFNSDSLLSINIESEVYKCLENNNSVTDFLVKKVIFDSYHNLLILKYDKIKEENLFFIYNARTSSLLAQKLSIILATFHCALVQEIDKDNPFFFQRKPGIFAITNEELAKEKNIRKINLIIKIGCKPRSKETILILKSILPYLSTIQYCQDTIIHNDIRYDNFIEGEKGIKLIDWELACWGDKYWDLASLFILFLQKSGSELWRGYTRNALGIIWHTYHAIREFTPTDDDLKKIIRFIGLKILENQIEMEKDEVDLKIADMIINPEIALCNEINIWETIKNSKMS